MSSRSRPGAPGGKWRRERLVFYKRSRDPAALMPLADVPRVTDEVRAAVHRALASRALFVAQEEGGLAPL